MTLKAGNSHRMSDQLGLPKSVITTPLNLLGELYEL